MKFDIPAYTRIVMAQMEPLNPFRTVVDLNGDWERYIHGKLFDVISVPSSLRPSGIYRLQRTFLLPRLSNGQRAVIHFEAITYYGKVFVNGHELGSMIPYLPHEFEFTQQAVEGRNTIEIEIADAHTTPDGAGADELRFGNCGGWECYGGIIRPVYVEVRAAAFIDSVRFGYQLAGDYQSVSCKAQVSVASAAGQSGSCELTLLWGKSEVAQVTKDIQLQPGSTEIEMNFDLKAPALWSPDEPNLYTLRAEVKTPTAQDRWSCRTGFREFKTDGPNFLLNGRRVVLNGVCRHDMWQNQGFTLSARQQEQDMRMIKTMGANFVRLVHYPHDRRIVDLAEQLGLLVSEEPGFWNMDFAKMPSSEIDLGCRILERTIRRDWNSPAVVIWLLGNECAFPLSYLKRGKAICDQFDPIHRLVSVADLYGKFPVVRDLYDEAGLDFYDWHAYEFSDDKFFKLPESFGPKKPFTLTEWGWEDAGDGDLFYEQDFDGLLAQVEAGKIAGHSFWSWNDLHQFNRVDWATHNGILLSGVVTESREIREPIYSRLAGLFAGKQENCGALAPGRLILPPLRWVPFSPGSTFQTVDLQSLVDSPAGQKSWQSFENSMEKFWAGSVAPEQWKRTGSHFTLWQDPELKIGGAGFRIPVVDGHVQPVLLTTDTAEITIPINQACSRLHILGQVSLPLGFPLRGGQGETVAAYTLQYANGKTQTLPVRNGIEVAQSNYISEATRIAPVATAAQPAAEYIKDIVRERYQLLLWSVPVEPHKLVNLRCKLNGQQPALAIFAITAEQAAGGTRR
jgi:hypothetical protein